MSRSTGRRLRPAERPGRHRPRDRRRAATVRIADVVIDLTRQRATRAGRVLALTALELSLLALMVQQAGRTVTRQRLSREIWKRTYDGTSNFVEVGMWRLRAKLDEHHKGRLIHAVRGVGYVCADRS